MDILQTLFSLWTGNRCTPDQKHSVTEAIKKHVPEDQQEQFISLLSECCEKLKRQTGRKRIMHKQKNQKLTVNYPLYKGATIRIFAENPGNWEAFKCLVSTAARHR